MRGSGARSIRVMLARVRAVAGLMVAVAAMVVIVLTADAGSRVRKSSVMAPLVGLRVSTPNGFVLVNSRPRGGVELSLRSVVTGRVIRTFGSVGRSFTNNGLSVTPDQRAVYLTVITKPSLAIERLDAATHRLHFVADGTDPAVSPDGQELAYTSARGSSDVLYVRNLRSGATRKLLLRSLTGAKRPLFNGRLAWTRDGSEIVISPGPAVVAISSGSYRSSNSPGGSSLSTGRRSAGSAGDGASAGAADAGTNCTSLPASVGCLIVVRVGASAGVPLRARLLRAPVPESDVQTISPDYAAADSVIADGPSGGRSAAGHDLPTTLRQVTIGASGVRITRIASIRRFLLAVSPARNRILYLISPAESIWVARIVDGRLGADHELLKHSRISVAVW